MGNVSTLKALRTAAIIVALPYSTDALAFDLSGAWASQRELCDRVFTRKGGVLRFAELSDLYGSGFIVNGNAIKAKAATCTIKSRQQEGDATVLTADCATSIMTSTLQFRYKAIDDNTLTRDFPEVGEMTLKYSRCPM